MLNSRAIQQIEQPISSTKKQHEKKTGSLTSSSTPKGTNTTRQAIENNCKLHLDIFLSLTCSYIFTLIIMA